MSIKGSNYFKPFEEIDLNLHISHLNDFSRANVRLHFALLFLQAEIRHSSLNV